MANEKNAQPKKGKNLFSRVIGWFAKLPGRIARPFQNMWRELKLVTWPTREELRNNSLIVLVFIVVMSIVIGALDLGATALVQALIG
jgi:preprotein translocase subunit SecE